MYDMEPSDMVKAVFGRLFIYLKSYKNYLDSCFYICVDI